MTNKASSYQTFLSVFIPCLHPEVFAPSTSLFFFFYDIVCTFQCSEILLDSYTKPTDYQTKNHQKKNIDNQSQNNTITFLQSSSLLFYTSPIPQKMKQAFRLARCTQQRCTYCTASSNVGVSAREDTIDFDMTVKREAEMAATAKNAVTGSTSAYDEIKMVHVIDHGLPPGPAERAAGSIASRSPLLISEELKNHPEYKEGISCLAWGHFDEALKHFDNVSTADPSYTHHPTLLVCTARCLMEVDRYDQALKILKKCSVLHAGASGLQELLEEATWGSELKKAFDEHARAKEARLDESRAKRGYYDKSDVKDDVDPNLETVNQLPLEPAVRDWLRSHVGDEALEKIGLAYEQVTGRSIVAKKFIKKGDVIFKENSTLFAPELLSDTFDDKTLDKKRGLLEGVDTVTARATYCSHCHGSMAGERHKCSDCGSFYCSQACQVSAAGSYHQHECKYLSNDAIKSIRDKLIAADHMDMWRRYQVIIRCASVARFVDPDMQMNEHPFLSHFSYVEGEHKQANVEREEPNAPPTSAQDHKVVPTMYGIMQFIFCHLYMEHSHGAAWKTTLQQEEINKTLSGVMRDYDELFDKVKANVNPQGVLLPFLAMANHSCTPTAHINSKNELVADEDIYPGGGVSVSYTPKGLPVEWKSFWLLKNRNFQCRCRYCYFRERDYGVLSNAAREKQSLQYVRENEVRRLEEADPTKTHTSDGLLTKRGKEEFENRFDHLLMKYPKEFRESMLQVQERVIKDMEEKPHDVLVRELESKKLRLARFEKLGLVPKEATETIGLDIALEAMESDGEVSSA